MKRSVLLGMLGFSVGAAIQGAEPAPAPAPGYNTAPKTTTAPAKASPAPAAPKKEEAMGKVEGTEIKRGSGYLGITIVSGNFKLTFYDAKRKIIPADVNRAVLHWPVAYRPTDDRTVLNLAPDGKSLTSAKVIKPPYNFHLFITLIVGEGEAEAGSETFNVDFKA